MEKDQCKPDKIAFLLNLIGEALISGKIECKNRNIDDLLGQAVSTLEATYVSSEQKKNILIEQAEKIDNKSWRNSSIFKMSNRLAEMQNVAKINIALIRIMQNDFERSKHILKDVREYADKNYSFVPPQNIRLERIEDFISMIDDDQKFPNEEAPKPEMIKEMDDQKYLEFLKEQLNITEDPILRAQIYHNIAGVYAKSAESNEQDNYLKSLEIWTYAKSKYYESHNLNKNDKKNILCYIQCLIKLNEFTSAKTFLEESKKLLSDESDYWYFLGICHKKTYDYSAAEDCLVNSLKLNSSKTDKNYKQSKEKDLVHHLNQPEQNKNSKNCIFQNLKLDITSEYYTRNRNDASKYKILSIDGGGTRGIIPAFWLNEIERKTNKPISHLFNMISGTSTGAIIAAGLATPAQNTFAPLYRAYDILELYRKCGKDIFSKPKSKLPKYEYLVPKYTDHGRSTLFRKYFNNLKLSQSLTELVIPAVKEDFVLRTHLFNTFDAKMDIFKNITYVDALMSTSAAPTFFPRYDINEVGKFIDGGVHVNNPSQHAYNAAVNNGINKENIILLSMGTGDYFPAINDSSFRGLVFWGKHLKDVAFSAQSGTSDELMHTLLGNKYQRMQIWFEDPIVLDDYSEESLSIMEEIANQYIEELYFTEDNAFKKILEVLQE